MERERWVLWLPVLIGLGITIYFSLTFEPQIYESGSFLTLTSCLALISRRRFPALSLISLMLAIMAVGFFSAATHSHYAKSNKIKETDKPIWVRGTVETIDVMNYGNRLILKDLDLWQPESGKFSKNEIPEKIRVNIRTKMEDGIGSGSRVEFRAILGKPPARPVYPNAYDFSMFAYFNKIGAVGYSISDVKIRHKEKQESTINENIREEITRRIIANFSGDKQREQAGAIATALITGQDGGISKKILEDMRVSGLGHLLSISGLHMALVMASCFFFLRFICALFPSFALKYDSKKPAAIFALIIGLLYLLITGLPIPAVRSYVMAMLFFTAIIFSRPVTPMRSVAWAAILILLYDPYSITTPSFQMSFGAVIALIAFFEKPYSKMFPYLMGVSLPKKFLMYFFGVIISSIVAGAATSPYAIYHFGRYANYSLLANLVAIPITSFWVMPLGIISVVMMPLGFEGFFLDMMGYGTEIIIDYTAYIANLGGADLRIIKPDSIFIWLVTIGGLWLCLWESRIRLLGFLPIAAAFIILILPSNLPDIIADGDGKIFALRNNDGALAFSNQRTGRYAKEQWLAANGQKKALRLDAEIKKGNIDAECEAGICQYNKSGLIALITDKNPDVQKFQEKCGTADIIIITKTGNLDCEDKKDYTILIQAEDLKKNGTYLVWLKNPIKVINVSESLGKRPWTAE